MLHGHALFGHVVAVCANEQEHIEWLIVGLHTL
jgi:hypothetical protein